MSCTECRSDRPTQHNCKECHKPVHSPAVGNGCSLWAEREPDNFVYCRSCCVQKNPVPGAKRAVQHATAMGRPPPRARQARPRPAAPQTRPRDMPLLERETSDSSDAARAATRPQRGGRRDAVEEVDWGGGDGAEDLTPPREVEGRRAARAMRPPAAPAGRAPPGGPAPCDAPAAPAVPAAGVCVWGGGRWAGARST